MKGLIVFFLTLLGVASVALSQEVLTPDHCDDVAGTWSNPTGNPTTYVCTEAQDKSFICHVTTVVLGVTCVIKYTGGWNATDADFSFLTSYESGPPSCQSSPVAGTLTVSQECAVLRNSLISAYSANRTKGTDGTATTVCEMPGTLSGSNWINGE